MRLTFLGDLLVPVVAFAYYKMFGRDNIWYADLSVAFSIFVIYLVRYAIIDINKYSEDKGKDILYLEVKPKDAANVSKEIYSKTI